MCIGRILFIAIFLFSSATLLTVSSALESVTNSEFLTTEVIEEVVNQQKMSQLEAGYKENLQRILRSFTSSPLSTEEMSTLEGQLLALSVPPDLKDLHFKLVTSLASINQSDQDEAAKSQRQRLEELINQYSWLTSTLSLFIMNNY